MVASPLKQITNPPLFSRKQPRNERSCAYHNSALPSYLPPTEQYFPNQLPRLAITLALCLMAISCSQDHKLAEVLPVTIGDRTFFLELALDHASHHRGLSDRQHIAIDGGMLFIFRRAQVREFVMRKCLVPIDLIYLGPNGRIAHMHAMKLEPYDTPDSQLTRYSSRYAVQFAIEIAGGTIESLGLQVGQKVHLPLNLLSKIAP